MLRRGICCESSTSGITDHSGESSVCGDSGESSGMCTAYATLQGLAAYHASAGQVPWPRQKSSTKGRIAKEGLRAKTMPLPWLSLLTPTVPDRITAYTPFVILSCHCHVACPAPAMYATNLYYVACCADCAALTVVATDVACTPSPSSLDTPPALLSQRTPFCCLCVCSVFVT